MTVVQSVIMIAAVALGTMLTRFLPFIIFPKGKKVPEYVIYLGKVLPYAVIGLLVVYCLKGITPGVWPYALPEIISVAAVVIVHLIFKKTLVSIAAGTILYMILIQTVF